MESLFETRVQNQKRWSFGPLFGSQIPLFAVLPQEETTTLLSLIMMLVTVILHVTVILLYLRLRLPLRLAGLVTMFLLLATIFVLITWYEVQSPHTESWSKFTLALNNSFLNFFNLYFTISWHVYPNAPGALADLHSY